MAIAGSFLFLSSTRTESWNIKFLPYIYSLHVGNTSVKTLVSLATNKGATAENKITYTLYLRENIHITKLLKALVFLSNNPEIP